MVKLRDGDFSGKDELIVIEAYMKANIELFRVTSEKTKLSDIPLLAQITESRYVGYLKNTN